MSGEWGNVLYETWPQNLGLPVHAVRRAVADGLIHGERIGPRRFVVSPAEESYLRGNWELLRGFRDALRTEPLVRLAVLFGPAAVDRAPEHYGVELLVDLNDADDDLVAETVGRVEARVGRTVRLTRLHDIEANASLMADVLRDGRVLADRDGEWPTLGALAIRHQPGGEAKHGVGPARQGGARAKTADQGAGQI